MDTLSRFPDDKSRRTFLSEVKAIGLTGVALHFFGFSSAEAALGYKTYDPTQDIFYLNRALMREHDVIMSYDFAIETGLFEKTAMAMFNMLQTDHFIHKDKLESAVKRLGGKPVAAKTRDDFNKEFNTELIRTGTDALRLNKRFESECFVNFAEIATYLRDPSLAAMSAQFSAEERMHKTLLVVAIGSVPYDYSLRIRD